MQKPQTKTLILLTILTLFCVIETIYVHSILFTKKPEVIKPDIIPYTNYDYRCFKGKEYLTYEDENYTSLFGIDVAAHQDIIDWQKVKAVGVDFAYIRLGYRGATEGKLNTDLQFEYNYKNAKENNILVGIYWYCQAINVDEAIKEAEYVLDVLDNRDLDLPIAFDFEETFLSEIEPSRMHDLDSKQRTDIARAFVEYMKENNQEVIIYTNLLWARDYYDNDFLSKQKIWFAQYSDIPELDLPFMIWQYTDLGYVNGIDRNVDLNIMFILTHAENQPDL